MGNDQMPADGRAPSFRGVLSRLDNVRDRLGTTSRRIADYIMSEPQTVVHMSVSDLAQATSASEGSVIALCKYVGASGFQEVKIVLAQEMVRPVQFIHEDLEPADDQQTVIDKIFGSDAQALRDTQEVLDARALQRAVDAIVDADRVELYGVGSAAPIVEDAGYRMLRIGLNCKVVVDSHVQAVSASLTDSRTATITVSHSGSTHETVAATRLAREAGAETICITNYGKSPIQAYSDIVLHTMARETHFRTEAMTSRIAQLAVVDALIASLALRNYETAVETIRRTAEVLAIKRY